MMKLIIILTIFVSALSFSCNGRLAQARVARKAEMEISGQGRSHVSRKVRAAKKKQEKKQQKIRKAYIKHIKASRKRTHDIQSAEVQDRMDQNQLDIKEREKRKARRARQVTRSGSGKYR